jgi:hypothetical protein
MELLLNLAWLLLALPAYWLWRSSRTADRKFTALQCLLALGCMLVLLFPVISATDDLHAMRAEADEFSATKRHVRQANNDKASAPGSQSPPALAARAPSFLSSGEEWRHQPPIRSYVPAAPGIERTGRAPPASFFV